MSEVNPNHPVTEMARSEWHKVVGLMMQRHGLTEFEVTSADVERLGAADAAVVMDCRGGRVVVRLMPLKEGERLARREGGLPV